MLFYFDVQPGDEQHLKTDASDYGIEAYLYIVQNGREITSADRWHVHS
jgi:hypothetical protein